MECNRLYAITADVEARIELGNRLPNATKAAFIKRIVEMYEGVSAGPNTEAFVADQARELRAMESAVREALIKRSKRIGDIEAEAAAIEAGNDDVDDALVRLRDRMARVRRECESVKRPPAAVGEAADCSELTAAAYRSLGEGRDEPLRTLLATRVAALGEGDRETVVTRYQDALDLATPHNRGQRFQHAFDALAAALVATCGELTVVKRFPEWAPKKTNGAPRGSVSVAYEVHGKVVGAAKELARLKPRLLACYHAGLELNPSLQGQASLVLALRHNGEVESVRGGGNAEGVVTCAKGVLLSGRFTAPTDVELMDVSLIFWNETLSESDSDNSARE